MYSPVVKITTAIRLQLTGYEALHCVSPRMRQNFSVNLLVLTKHFACSHYVISKEVLSVMFLIFSRLNALAAFRERIIIVESQPGLGWKGP